MSKNIYMNKERYKCTECNEELPQWEFDVFDKDRKVCYKCFDRVDPAPNKNTK